MKTDNKTLETERLILRPWNVKDAEKCYEYCRDPEIGPVAGFPMHTSIANSTAVILTVLIREDNFAIVLKESGELVGSIGLTKESKQFEIKEDEAEIGYWLGKPFWGRGLMPEAVREIMRYAKEELGLTLLYCCYYNDNEKSHRVMQKCGFKDVRTLENVYVEAMNEYRTLHITSAELA